MSANIYYFSGTGNSLVVARDIAGKVNGKLVSMASVMKEENVKPEADVIGIVFPVYYVPEKRYMRRHRSLQRLVSPS